MSQFSSRLFMGCNHSRCLIFSFRGAVSLECARMLQHGPEQRVELFQIIGQDSYEGAVRKSNGSVLNKLLQPLRSLIVTPRERGDGEVGGACAEIFVPPQHSSRVFVLDGYKDEMVLQPPHNAPPSLRRRALCLTPCVAGAVVHENPRYARTGM